MMEAVRSLLIQAQLPRFLWPIGIKHVTYVRNRVQHLTTGELLMNLFYNERPDH